MKQNTLKPAAGSTHSKKRLGRGKTRGNYSGKGVKGQKARTGGRVRPGFAGGQTPLLRAMPKLKGFTNHNRVVYMPVNLDMLEAHFKDGDEVTVKALIEKRIIRKEGLIKVLATGTITKKLTIVADKASESAQKKVEKAGGSLKLPSSNA